MSSVSLFKKNKTKTKQDNLVEVPLGWEGGGDKGRGGFSRLCTQNVQKISHRWRLVGAEGGLNRPQSLLLSFTRTVCMLHRLKNTVDTFFFKKTKQKLVVLVIS